MERRPAATLVACESAWLAELAMIWMVPLGAEYDAPEPTIVCVTAPLFTCASATVTATGMPPIVIASTSISAKLWLSDCTVMPDASVTSPLMLMVVPPFTFAVGTAMATERKPPDATSLRVFEWLFECALISMRPVALSSDVDAPSTSTSALLVISEFDRLKLPEKPKLPLMTNTLARAKFSPSAVTAMAGDPGVAAAEVVVTWPSSWTRTAPSMVAIDTMIDRAATPPSDPSEVSANARLCWLRAFASIVTGPELVRYADDPIMVSML